VISTNLNIGSLVVGLILLGGLFFAGMWVGVWLDDEEFRPDTNQPDNPELERLMHIARVMQKMQHTIANNHALISSPIGTIGNGDEPQAFDEGFDQGFS
jgi:hypothetical protein